MRGRAFENWNYMHQPERRASAFRELARPFKKSTTLRRRGNRTEDVVQGDMSTPWPLGT